MTLSPESLQLREVATASLPMSLLLPGPPPSPTPSHRLISVIISGPGAGVPLPLSPEHLEVQLPSPSWGNEPNQPDQ